MLSQAAIYSDSAGGNSFTSQRAVSADGRYVAFVSSAPNLVSGLEIAPGLNQVYRYDRTTDEVVLVSVNFAGTASGNFSSDQPTISADGSVVAFQSFATNLHSLDGNTILDIFVRDLTSGTTHLVSVNASGTGSGDSSSSQPTISADGSVVAFVSNASNLHSLDGDIISDIFARDLSSGTTHLVSVNSAGNGSGNSSSFQPAISADGSVVAFVSNANNLVGNDSNGGALDVFARNLTTGTTHLVSVNAAGTGSGNNGSDQPTISADGSVVAFRSSASNLHSLGGNTISDIFARDLSSGITHLVSVNSAGAGSGNDYSDQPTLSADGSVVAFRSSASNLHPLDGSTNSDIFARDLSSGTTHLVSVNSAGAGSGNNYSDQPTLSADGLVVAFVSNASNLHSLDENTISDIFAHDLASGTTHLVSVNAAGSGSGSFDSSQPTLSADGSVVAFQSYASNLVEKDWNGAFDVFASERRLANSVPTGVAGGPYTVDEGSTISLDATGSTDAEQDPGTLSYEWDFDYDGVTFDVNATGATPTVLFSDDFAAHCRAGAG